MTKATSVAILLVVSVTTILVAAQPASGQWRWRRSRVTRSSRPAVTTSTVQPTYSARYRRPYPADYYYPKYTGGFHARYYDGIPSIYGTRPMRGTAW